MDPEGDIDVGDLLREFDEENADVFGSASDVFEKAGDPMGKYRLIELLGEGGFGSVWRASQEQPVRREVALKILKSGMDSREILGRFEQERQVLALMDHPDIARIFDAGVSPSGRSYFVMELIPDAVPLTLHCEEGELALPERLDLFVRVCRAVMHAHQKGVIHRDLKPSNILATKRGREREIKVIDFGIAKATEDGQFTDRTILTRANQVFGTPTYMSPELLAGMGGSDTRTDVYSLGIVLYEILTGTTPFPETSSESMEPGAIAKAIRERLPKKPSTVVVDSGDAKKFDFRSELQGDLDSIVLKAVDPEVDRRYGSPAQLADDIGRYLNREPIQARPQSRLYVAKRFAQRHRTAVIGAVGILVALLGGLAVSSTLFLREREARQLANQEVERSQQVTRILRDTLSSAGVSKTRGRDATMMKEILEETALRIETEEFAAREIEVELREIVGETYEDLEEYTKARVQFEKNVAMLREDKPGSFELAKALVNLSSAFEMEGRIPPSTVAVDEALGLLSEFDERDPVLTQRAKLLRAYLYAKGGAPEEGLALAKEGYEFWVAHPEAERLDEAADTYALCLNRTGRREEAIQVYQHAIEVWRKYRKPGAPVLVRTLDNMGMVLVQAEKFEEAETALKEAFAEGRKVFGDRNPHEDHILSHLAKIEAKRGNSEEELRLLREGFAAAGRVYPRGHRYYKGAEKALVDALFRQAGQAGEGGEKRAKALLEELTEREADGTPAFFGERMDQLRSKILP